MLLKTKDRNVDSFGASESTQFKISTAGGKAFRILIDRIYADKIGAPVRELFTNAYDSHCSAGIPDKPFTVHIPNEFEPEFSVRDYGVSMDHETVMGLYSTVFESTKDEANDEVGMFGLGSKSPFAYTDVFTVETYLNGEQRLYSCYAGKDGTPRIDLMGTQPTTEPNGVRVSFPVEPGDVPQFKRAIMRVCLGFDVLPEVNAPEVLKPLTELETLVEGNGWKVYAPVKGDLALAGVSEGRASVRQGCVIYPLNLTPLLPLNDADAALASMNMIMDMPIGSVDIKPDREGLSYDSETIANIQSRLKEIGVEVVKDIEEKVSHCRTFAEAVTLRNELCRSGGSYYFRDQVFAKAKFRGRQMRSTVGIPHGVPSLMRLRQKVMCISSHDLLYGRSARSSVWNARWDANDAHVDPATALYYIERVGGDERVTHAGIRLREHYKELRASGDHRWERAVWIKYSTDMELKRILVCYGRPAADQIVDLAKLPKPKVSVNRGGRSTVMCKKLITTPSGRLEDVMIDSDDETIVYIATRRNEFVDHHSSITPRSLAEWTVYLKENGYLKKDARIVQIPATHAKLIERNKDIWTNFFDVVDKCVEAEFTPLGYAYQTQWRSLAPADHESRKAWTLARSMAAANVFPKKRGDLWELVKRARVLYKAKERFGCAKVVEHMHSERKPNFDLHAVVNSTPYLVDPADIGAYAASLFCAYPLMTYAVSSYHDNVDTLVMERLLEYINAMDAAK